MAGRKTCKVPKSGMVEVRAARDITVKSRTKVYVIKKGTLVYFDAPFKIYIPVQEDGRTRRLMVRVVPNDLERWGIGGKKE